MTLTRQPLVDDVEDRPRQAPRNYDQLRIALGSAVAGFVLVWTPFHLIGLNAPFGFVVLWFAAFTTIYAVVIRQLHGSLHLKNSLATLFICTATAVALLPLGLLLVYVFQQGGSILFHGFPSLHFVQFITRDLAHYGPSAPATTAGVKEAMIGTLEQVGIATLISVPIGVLAATYLNEVGGRFAAIVRAVADAMTGLPSIIAGLFIYSAWVLPKILGGYSGFAGALALAVVMLPTVVRTAEEVLRLVSNTLREAALALGAPQWRTVTQVVLPTARTGLVTAAILGVARAVGETAPVLFTAFGAQATNLNPFHKPQDDLPLRIYQFALGANKNDHQIAWGGALLLMLIILTLFALARILGSGGPDRRRRGPMRRISGLVATVRKSGAPAT